MKAACGFCLSIGESNTVMKSLKIFIILFFAECLIGIAEILLALAYLFGFNEVELSARPYQVLLMILIYALFVALLIFAALKTISARKANHSPKKAHLILALIVEGVLSVYMIIQILSGFLTRIESEYFLLSLSWNVPRLLINLSLIMTCAIFLLKIANKNRIDE
jgi:hypothetical protein